jgi:DNA-directed RNA polymerase subunit alpha
MLNLQQSFWTPKIFTSKNISWADIYTVDFFPRWFGHTVWNAFRRLLLWYNAWASVTAMKIAWVTHEYQTIDWLKESILDIMLNCKKLRFQVENEDLQYWIKWKISWNWIFTGWDITLPAWISCYNEETYICEVSDTSLSLDIELRIEKWYAYYSLEYLRARETNSQDNDVHTLLIDNDFRLVEYVSYHIEQIIDDFAWNAKDRLILEIKPISNSVDTKKLLSFSWEVLASYAKLFIFDQAYVDLSLLIEYDAIQDIKDSNTGDFSVKVIPIDALPLSERTRNALIKNDILYVEDLAKKRKSELMTMKGIWRKAVDEINVALAEMWKSLE